MIAMTEAMIPHMTPSTGSPNDDAPVAARTLVPPAFAVVEAVLVAAAWELRADLRARRVYIFCLAAAAFRFDSAFFFAFAALPASLRRSPHSASRGSAGRLWPRLLLRFRRCRRMRASPRPDVRTGLRFQRRRRRMSRLPWLRCCGPAWRTRRPGGCTQPGWRCRRPTHPRNRPSACRRRRCASQCGLSQPAGPGRASWPPSPCPRSGLSPS